MSALALTFRIFRGDQLVREETLHQSVIKIGKVSSAHLRLDDESVSRMHAILEVDRAGDVLIIDLGSTRGTFINGQRINKAKLESGDAIGVGSLRLEVAFVQMDAVIVMAPAVAPGVTLAPPPVPLPVVVAKRVTPVASASLALFAHMAQEADGGQAKAIEVAAMLGDSVIGVKHCIDPKSGTISRKTKMMFGVGATCLLASAISFGASLHTAAANKAALDHLTRDLHHPAWSFRPQVLDPAFDVIGFAGLALGVSMLIAGLSRVRGERRTPYYRIGTASGVELAIEHAPTPSFPLVAPSSDGRDFVFNYGAGIEGEMVVDGQTTTLAELATSGRARPSMTTAGALELPIPARARIRARAGQTTFVVSAVPQPRTQPTSLLATFERRTVKFFVGSLAAHLIVLALLDTMPVEDSTIGIDLADKLDPNAKILATANEEPVAKPEPTADGVDTGAAGTVSMKAPGEEGAAGKPASSATNKHLTVKDNHTESQLAGQNDLEAARTAGIMGTVMANPETFQTLISASNISSGLSDANLYGNIYGAEAGDANGTFGLGRSGLGGGGGCVQEPCGLIGSGDRFKTIGGGLHAGGEFGPGGGTGPGLRHHDPVSPRPVLGQATGSGDLDQATIRRYIKRNIEKLSYCYEHEMLAHPGLEGTISAHFFISPTGAVTGSTASGFDATVARCVGDVIGNIEFPKPRGGGGVQVNYPFTFHAAQ